MSVRVAVRCRPMNEREKRLGSSCIVEMHDESTILHDPEDTRGYQPRQFTFDHSFWSYDSQDEHYVNQQHVYNEIGNQVMKDVVEGYNTCVFAYGQTGAGKSYSMMGGHGADRGIIPRLCENLFSIAQEKQCDLWTAKVEVRFMEIYLEKVRDLLNLNKQQPLKVREHQSTGPYVEGLSSHAVCDFPAVKQLMEDGNKMRTVAATTMNNVSSRSHAIFQLVFTQTQIAKRENKVVRTERVSIINLVDLAGSERSGQINTSQGSRLKEGNIINKSLSTLGKVISALADMSAKKKTLHVPYRDSTLTQLLRESLGGNSKTVMLAAISPAADNYDETLSTLRYASQAKRIVNKAVVNEDATAKMLRELNNEISILRLKLQQAQLPSGAETSIGTLSNTVCLGDRKFHTVEQLQSALQESEKLVLDLNKSWDTKMKQTSQMQQHRARVLAEHGIIMDSQSRPVGVTAPANVPYLINILHDPATQECLMYYLREGITLVTGGDEEFQEALNYEDENCDFTIDITYNDQDGEILIETDAGTNSTKQQSQINTSRLNVSNDSTSHVPSNIYPYENHQEESKCENDLTEQHMLQSEVVQEHHIDSAIARNCDFANSSQNFGCVSHEHESGSNKSCNPIALSSFYHVFDIVADNKLMPLGNSADDDDGHSRSPLSNVSGDGKSTPSSTSGCFEQFSKIVLHGKGVLREHCEFHCIYQDGFATVSIDPLDTPSLVLNDESLLQPMRLKTGDIIRLSSCHMFCFHNPFEVNQSRQTPERTLYTPSSLENGNKQGISLPVSPSTTSEQMTYFTQDANTNVLPVSKIDVSLKNAQNAQSKQVVDDDDSEDTDMYMELLNKSQVSSHVETTADELDSGRFEIQASCRSRSQMNQKCQPQAHHQGYQNLLKPDQLHDYKQTSACLNDDIILNVARNEAVYIYQTMIEDALLSELITDATVERSRFKLFPAYACYLLIRGCQRSMPSHTGDLLRKVTTLFQMSLMSSHDLASRAFLLANCTELSMALRLDVSLTAHGSAQALQNISEIANKAHDMILATVKRRLKTLIPALLFDASGPVVDCQPEERPTSDDRPSYQHSYITKSALFTTLDAMWTVLNGCLLSKSTVEQIFEDTFAYIGDLCFNIFIDTTKLFSCDQGILIRFNISQLTEWAQKKGLSIEDHLAHITQAVQLLQAQKTHLKYLDMICDWCCKLNSIQMEHILTNYKYACGEEEGRIPKSLIDCIKARFMAGIDKRNLQEDESMAGRLQLHRNVNHVRPFRLSRESHFSFGLVDIKLLTAIKSTISILEQDLIQKISCDGGCHSFNQCLENKSAVEAAVNCIHHDGPEIFTRRSISDEEFDTNSFVPMVNIQCCDHQSFRGVVGAGSFQSIPSRSRDTVPASAWASLHLFMDATPCIQKCNNSVKSFFDALEC